MLRGESEIELGAYAGDDGSEEEDGAQELQHLNYLIRLRRYLPAARATRATVGQFFVWGTNHRHQRARNGFLRRKRHLQPSGTKGRSPKAKENASFCVCVCLRRAGNFPNLNIKFNKQQRPF